MAPTIYRRHSSDCPHKSKGRERVRGWEASGQVGVIRNEIPTIKEAIEKHVEDAKARNLKPQSLKRIKDVLQRRFLEYCHD